MYFDLWHYFGRTAKHGAYMGGADYVQWHGNYELIPPPDRVPEARCRIAGAQVTALAGMLDWAARERRKLLLGFIGLNFLAMAVDCALAHWSVDFYHPGMYVALGVPLVFGLVVLFFTLREPKRPGRIVLEVVAWVAAGSGLLGLWWHLAGQFLQEPRMQSLVYSAPIAGSGYAHLAGGAAMVLAAFWR